MSEGNLYGTSNTSDMMDLASYIYLIYLINSLNKASFVWAAKSSVAQRLFFRGKMILANIALQIKINPDRQVGLTLI